MCIIRGTTRLQNCIHFIDLDEVIPKEKEKLLVVIVDFCSMSVMGGVARTHERVLIVVMLPSLICGMFMVHPVCQVSF